MTKRRLLLIRIEEWWSRLFGPRVIYVTTTAKSGKGSFSAALAMKGPRVIKFAVDGPIEVDTNPGVRH